MAIRTKTDFRPIETAPRDGTLIVLRADDAPDVEMRWNPLGMNMLVQPGPGIWEHPSGELTWSEYDPAGAPTHWRSAAKSDAST